MDSTSFYMDSTSFHHGFHTHLLWIPHHSTWIPHHSTMDSTHTYYGFHIIPPWIPGGFHNFLYGFHIISQTFYIDSILFNTNSILYTYTPEKTISVQRDLVRHPDALGYPGAFKALKVSKVPDRTSLLVTHFYKALQEYIEYPVCVW